MNFSRNVITRLPTRDMQFGPSPVKAISPGAVSS
jgi:hypothetical protein